MAHKKKAAQNPGGHRGPGLPRPVAEAVSQAAALIENRRFEEALGLLRDIDRRTPGNGVVLQLLAEAAYEVNDHDLFLDASERLAAAAPNDADFQAQRAFAHAQMGLTFLAQRYFQQVIQRWPDHPKAAQSRQTLEAVEAAIARTTEQMAEAGIPAADAPELGARHEQVQVWLARRKFAEARRVATQLLSRWPNFAPALNNQAEAWFHEGNLTQAVAATRQALAAVSDNCHAQANLVRFLVLDGKGEEAREAAARLKSMPVQSPDNRLKKAEALSLLGDDAAVLEVWAEAAQEGFRLADPHLAYLHHLAAVAAYRLGDEKRARQLWASCFKAMPTFSRASECIDDLDLPAGEQNGPWSVTIDSWIPRGQLEELLHRCSDVGAAGHEARTQEEVRRFLAQHPHIVHAVPPLLERGDPLGREIAVRVAGIARTPELLGMLRDFALSQRGPDRLRVHAAFVLAQEGQLPQGEARLWLGGGWQARHLPICQVSGEPTGERLPPRIDKMLERAQEAMEQGDFAQAEEHFRQAQAGAPEGPSIPYNIANMLIAQGREGEGLEMIREVHRKYPDYLFGILSEARDLLRERRFDEAERLIAAVLQRPRLHVTEFYALTLAELELALARKQPDEGRFWVALLEAVAPGHPQMAEARALAGMRP